MAAGAAELGPTRSMGANFTASCELVGPTSPRD